MPFSPLCQIAITDEWQATPPTQGNYFRFQYSNNSGFSYLVVAQAQVSNGGSLELFGTFRFNLKSQSADIAQLEIPAVFLPEQRCLAVRGLGSRNQPGKTLTLNIEETSMIINPQGTTSKEKRTDIAQATASGEGVAANADRNGGIIFNKGTKAVFIGFGVNAQTSSPHKILPGGQMDLPEGFTGAINYLWEAIDAAPNARAIVMEMTA